MRDFEDPPLHSDAETVRIEEERPKSSLAVPLGVTALLVAAVIGGGWYFLRRPAPPPSAARPATGEADAAETAAETAPAVERTFVLPALDASDAVLRDLARRLSANPQLLAWFAHDELVRRFVATVSNLAEGASPAIHVRFLTPSAGFAARDDGKGATVDPVSYRRYDLATEGFASLNTAATAKLYRELQPLLDQAYQELGYPGRSFDEPLARAITRLLSVEIPDGPPELVAQGAAGWAYADPALESLSSAEKHLLRLGPENGRRAQAKLRELAAALDLPANP